MTKKTKKIIIAFTVICIYCGIPVLILLNILNFDHKFYYLTIGAILVYAIMRILGFKNSEMGITLKNSKESIKHILPITTCLLIATVILFLTGKSQRFQPDETLLFYIFYIFISSPVQEFLYRGALNKMFNYLNMKENFIWVLSTALYSFAHIIYYDPLVLLLTFIIGLIWYRCYIKTNNLIGVSISHAILGVITIVAGFIQ